MESTLRSSLSDALIQRMDGAATRCATGCGIADSPAKLASVRQFDRPSHGAFCLPEHSADEEFAMPKGVQRSNKLVKKPKKDSLAPRELSTVSPRPTPPVTLVMPKGKMKKLPS
jgi:hypothetical protein